MLSVDIHVTKKLNDALIEYLISYYLTRGIRSIIFSFFSFLSGAQML